MTNAPLGISLQIYVVINAKIQACMKLIGNHAKESCSKFLKLVQRTLYLTQLIQTSCFHYNVSMNKVEETLTQIHNTIV